MDEASVETLATPAVSGDHSAAPASCEKIKNVLLIHL